MIKLETFSNDNGNKKSNKEQPKNSLIKKEKVQLKNDKLFCKT